MLAIQSLSTSEVSNLEFVQRLDALDGNWASWEVGFDFNNAPHSGILQAAIISPDDLHDDEITEIEPC